MEATTILALRRLNRRFYEQRAESFDRTRTSPWHGWRGLIEVLAPRLASGWRGLEAGCGNGRLAAFFTDHLPSPASYVGLDFSLPLLRRAQRRLGAAPYHWLLADLADPVLPIAAPAPGFDLAAAIAVLHHLPTAELRRAVVRGLSERLRPGGLLLLSFWDFSTRADHRWAESDDSLMPRELRGAQLEPRGALLPWGRSGAALRYCHLTSPDEQRAMLAELPLDPVATIVDQGGPGAGTLYRFLCKR